MMMLPNDIKSFQQKKKIKKGVTLVPLSFNLHALSVLSLLILPIELCMG